MELIDFIRLIKQKLGTIFTITMIFLALAFVLNIAQPLRYGSEFKMLIIQNNLNNADPYMVSKSSEHLGNVLAQVMASHSFFEKVMTSGFNIDRDYFGQSLKEQDKIWSSSIATSNVADTGILDVTIYNTNRAQAEQIAEAVGTVMKTEHKQYHGGGDNVDIKIIDEPLTSTLPVKPNILSNLLATLVLSIVLSLIYVYLFPEEKYDLRLIPRKAKKQIRAYYNYNDMDEEAAKKRFETIIKRNVVLSEKEEIPNFVKHREILPEQAKDLTKGEPVRKDDLDVDYDRILKGGNIKNIL